MQSMFDDYIDDMEVYDSTLNINGVHNKKVKKNLAIVKWVKHAVKFGVAVASSGGTTLSQQLISGLLQFAPEIGGSDSTKIKDRWEKIFKAAEKILGEELMTYINDNFKEKESPAVPIKPMANFSEMNFKGRMQDIDTKNGPTIYTPGTYGSSITNDLPNQHFYPVYNDALGVFALLKSPKINISRTFKDFSCEVYKSTPFSNFDYWPEAPYEGSETYDLNEANIEEEIQIELAEELKYTFNSSLTIKNYTIETSFIVEGGLKLSTNPYSNSLSYSSDESTQIISLPNRNINIESSSFNPKEIEVYKDNNIIFDDLDYQTLHVPIDALNSSTFSFGINKKFTEKPLWITRKDRINSIINRPYSSCSFINDLLTKDVVTNYEIGDIYLKLIINVTFEGEKTDGSPHEYTYVFTYKINPEDIDDSFTNSLYPNLPGSAGDITQYPENLYLNEVNFDGSQIEGCTLNGTIYNCKAWNDITLSGDFMVGNGINVLIEAGNEVLVEPETNTPPEMIWQVDPVLDFSNPMPAVISDTVTSFCGNIKRYQANSSNMPIFNNDSTIVYEEDVRDIFDFSIFPNPTSGSSTVSITLNESAKGDLFITDMNGRTLGTAFKGQTLRGGQTEHQLPTASLASGIYLVHLFVDGERHVKRLVKQ
ncbi:T9SS type A sorting domain-containing protein [Brumimicrobium glaciale]|nr:T9SS type A sorting domain-containing protein [Brumimicrobium glaciale]